MRKIFTLLFLLSATWAFAEASWDIPPMPAEYPEHASVGKAIAALWNESIEAGVDGYLERGDPAGASAYLNEKYDTFNTYWGELMDKLGEYLELKEENLEGLPVLLEWGFAVAITAGGTKTALDQRILYYGTE